MHPPRTATPQRTQDIPQRTLTSSTPFALLASDTPGPDLDPANACHTYPTYPIYASHPNVACCPRLAGKPHPLAVAPLAIRHIGEDNVHCVVVPERV